MIVNFFTEGVDFPFKTRGIKTTLRAYLSNLLKSEDKKGGAINLIFCSDEYLLNMNNQYLNHNYYTDVITFDYSKFPVISGDIFISIDTVRKNAMEYAPSFEHELYRVIFHGTLHLCGYKDELPDDVKLMREKENFYLSLNELNSESI